MEYLITFLEGIASFISPCILPMLPIYVAYFAGGNAKDERKVLKNSLGFVLGFTVIFVLLGIFAGTLGSFIQKYKLIINIVMGIIVIIFGLNYLGILKIKILNRKNNIEQDKSNLNFLSSILFGIIFAICWSPCVGVYLSSALMLSASYGSVLKGAILLLIFSLGIGLPLVISAVLIKKLENTFLAIKKHYNLINKISGIFLILIGILIMFDINSIFSKFLR